MNWRKRPKSDIVYYSLVIFAIFILSGILGLAASAIGVDIFRGNIITSTEMISEQLSTRDSWTFFSYVLTKNASLMFILVSLSVLRKKWLPAGMVAWNGFIIFGTATVLASLPSIVLLSAIPHGIIEIPAMILACAHAWRAIDNAPSTLDREFLRTYVVRPYAWIVFPLVLAAAVTEAYISFPLLMGGI